MSDRRYQNITRAVLETPWAIRPGMLAVIVEVLSLRLEGHQLSDEEIQARVGGKPSRQDTQIIGQTAIIPIYGTLIPRADSMTQMSGGTPVDRLQGALQDAVRSADVSNILLDISSPGGATDLIPEFAQQIRDARRVKPVVASANTQAASAAYWLGSQASEFVASPSAGVGSIGVFAAHEDLSKQLEADGVSTTVITAGKYKAETGPWAPLTDEARAHIQERVDDMYQMFTGDVAKGRKTTVDAVRGGFGEGRMLNAKAALKEGMIDAIEPITATIGRLADAGGQKVAQVAFSDVPALAAADPGLEANAIRPHSTATTDVPWDGPQQKANLSNDRPETYRLAYAWYDENGKDADGDGYPDAKDDYKFIHHQVSTSGDVGAANVNGCSQGIAVLNGGRTGTTIPDKDRQGVYDHLAKHLSDAGKKPPPLQSHEATPGPAHAGLTFAARLRETRERVEDDLATVRSLADVSQRDRLTGPKREQLEAIADTLGAFGKAHSDIVALLAQTTPAPDVAEVDREAWELYRARALRLSGGST